MTTQPSPESGTTEPSDSEMLDWLEKPGSFPKMVAASEKLVAETGGAGPFPAHTWRAAIRSAIERGEMAKPNEASGTPLTDKADQECTTEVQVLDRMRQLEQAANALAERCREMVEHIGHCNERRLLACDIDPHPPSVFSVYAELMEADLRAFERLKEGR